MAEVDGAANEEGGDDNCKGASSDEGMAAAKARGAALRNANECC